MGAWDCSSVREGLLELTRRAARPAGNPGFGLHLSRHTSRRTDLACRTSSISSNVRRTCSIWDPERNRAARPSQPVQVELKTPGEAADSVSSPGSARDCRVAQHRRGHALRGSRRDPPDLADRALRDRERHLRAARETAAAWNSPARLSTSVSDTYRGSRLQARISGSRIQFSPDRHPCLRGCRISDLNRRVSSPGSALCRRGTTPASRLSGSCRFHGRFRSKQRLTGFRDDVSEPESAADGCDWRGDNRAGNRG